ncbi:hypothetical protein D3C78_800690 [compost metagenome]
MQERCRNKGNSPIIHQTDTHTTTANIDNLRCKTGISTGFVTQETRIQPVTDITFSHAVQTTALSHLYSGFILRTRNGFAFHDRFQQTMVNHVAVFTDRGSPCRVRFKA